MEPRQADLLMNGTIGGRFGTYIVSALGGAPRFLTGGSAAFYAGGDSLLLGPVSPAESFAVRVAGLDGTVGDSIHVPGQGSSRHSCQSQGRRGTSRW